MVKQSFLLKLEKTLHVQCVIAEGNTAGTGGTAGAIGRTKALRGDENLGERVSLGKEERRTSA